VSVEGKGTAKTMSGEVQGDERKRTTDEVSKTIAKKWSLVLCRHDSISIPEVIIGAFCLNAADFNLYLWIHKNDNPPNPACGRFKTLEAFKIL